MEIPLPKIVQTKKTDYLGIFEISPLYPGYGVTVANSMRRVLLSSLAGYAVDRVKIDGIDHEFSTLEGMKEDVLAFLLTLKNLRVKLISGDEATLSLDAKGPKEIKARDIKTPSNVEILNPDLVLMTLNKEGKIKAEIHIKKGIGYVTQEEKLEDEKLNGSERSIGEILLDSIYSPVLKVNFETGYVQVGRRTDFDKVTLTIETDGSIDSKDAVMSAAKILADHFAVLAEIKKEEKVTVDVEKGPKLKAEKKEKAVADEKKKTIAELNLSTRTANALMNNNIKTVSGLLRLSEEKLINLEGLGEKGAKEILAKLKKLGLIEK
ncbi:MAG: DNA-directed RNA polymerase subunit alpha [Patescibacteria group bacterium]|nr:DNA-directed RNA polymerase subunit alpha [Patescibacteria group bacterium]